MVKKIKIGDRVRLTKSGYEKRKEQYPGFSPSSTTGIVTGTGFNKKEMIVAISDGESNSLLIADLVVVTSAPRGYKHPNAPTEERVEEFTEELHGSGIDYGWEVEETKTSFRASNAFHTMDEWGGYDAVVPFTIIFPKKLSMEDFKLQFASGSQYQVEKHMLREYLEETIAYAVGKLWKD